MGIDHDDLHGMLPHRKYTNSIRHVIIFLDMRIISRVLNYHGLLGKLSVNAMNIETIIGMFRDIIPMG